MVGWLAWELGVGRKVNDVSKVRFAVALCACDPASEVVIVVGEPEMMSIGCCMVQ